MTIVSEVPAVEVNPQESVVSTIADALVLLSNTEDVELPNVTVTAIAPEEDDIPIAIMEPILQESCQEESTCMVRRSAIISVTVPKSKSRCRPGILLKEVDDVLRIAAIDSEGLFQNTPVSVGDRVLSINNTSCEKTSATHASRLIQRAKRSVTLVVHRADGDPYLMSTTVTKPEATSRVGIGVQIYNGSLRISSIDPSGLFAGGILNVGDKVVSICSVNCSCMDANSAIELIRQEKRAVTIVTWTEEEAGVVVAATKPIPIISRYKMFLPCLFSITLVSIIALIVVLTSRDHESSSESDEGDHPCRNLYGQPIPYC